MTKKTLVLFYLFSIFFLVTGVADADSTNYAPIKGNISNNSKCPWVVSTKSQDIQINGTSPFTQVTINPGEEIIVSYDFNNYYDFKENPILMFPHVIGKIEIMDYKKQAQEITASFNDRVFPSRIEFTFSNGFENIISLQAGSAPAIKISGDAWA